MTEPFIIVRKLRKQLYLDQKKICIFFMSDSYAKVFDLIYCFYNQIRNFQKSLNSLIMTKKLPKLEDTPLLTPRI